MKQMFYVDADEEITSIVDNLRSSKASENYFVVPPKALFIQSAVNLKLLKREAEKLKKKIVLVSQGELVQSMAKRVGIETQSSTEAAEKDSPLPASEPVFSYEKSKDSGPYSKSVEKRNWLESIGSESFYGDKETEKREDSFPAQKMPSAAVFQRKEPPARGSESDSRGIIKDVVVKPRISKEEKFPPVSAGGFRSFDQVKNSKLESIFRKQERKEEREPDEKAADIRHPVPSAVKKIFVFLGAACLVLVLGVAAYIFLPKSRIIVHPLYDVSEVDVQLDAKSGNENYNAETGEISAQIKEKELKISQEFSSTGKTSSSDKKARGTIMIYNEYNTSSQPLVATTRFLSEDKKLFRIVKGVVVPGMKKEGEEMKPGTVEAEVIADEAGEEYNIGPARFSIPGFEGGPKYEKFYALSQTAMTGGATDESVMKSVTQGDIDSAKSEMEEKFKKDALEFFESTAEEGEDILGATMEKTINKVTCQAKTDDIGDSFSCNAEGTAKIFSIKKEDVEKLIIDSFSKKQKDKESIDIHQVKYEIRQADADFASQSAEVRVRGKVYLRPKIEISELEKDILGKTEEEIIELLKKYPQIEKIEVQYQPSFLDGRVPRFDWQVNVEIMERSF